MLSVCFIVCVAFAAAALRNSLEAGFVGLSLAYALRLTGSFQWYQFFVKRILQSHLFRISIKTHVYNSLFLSG